VVYPKLLDDYNVEYLYASLILMGAIEIIVAILGWPRYIAIIPEPVMIGFVNGLAIVIGMAQITAFKYTPLTNGTLLTSINGAKVAKVWVEGDVLWYMILEMLIAVLIIHFWPRVPKIGTLIPPPLVAIVVVTALEHGAGLNTRCIEDVGDVSGSLPVFHVPDVPWGESKTWGIIIVQAIIYSCIGLTESLMTSQLIDKITETKGNGVAEAAAQGVGNLLCGFFSAMGGCAMIGQSQINVRNGSRTRLAGIISAVMVMIVVLAAYTVINLIPVASLVGVMVIVVVNTFDWNSFRYLRRLPGSEGFVIILVTAVTVYTGDLAIAVACGVVATCINYCWVDGNAFDMTEERAEGPNGQKLKVYTPVGRLYFTSRKPFEDQLSAEMDPGDVTVDFAACKWDDFTALCCLAELIGYYKAKDKMLWLINVNQSSLMVMREAGTTTNLFTCGRILPLKSDKEDTIVTIHKAKTDNLICKATGDSIKAGDIVVGLTDRLDSGACFTNWFGLETTEAKHAVAKLDLTKKELTCGDEASDLKARSLDCAALINNDGFETNESYDAWENKGLSALSVEDIDALRGIQASPKELTVHVGVEDIVQEVPDEASRECARAC